MTAIDYHRAHEAYVGAVADALHEAGFPIPDYHADANDPRDAAIQLTDDPEGTGGTDERFICWTEESGWYHGIDQEGHGGLTMLRWANLGVLPTPAEIVQWVRRVQSTRTDHAELHRPRYRSFEDQQDGFEQELAAYNTKGQP